MSTPTTATSLQLSRLINASPDDVFRAWTEPEKIGQWSAPEGDAVEADVDLRIGGAYRLRMTSPDGGHHTAYGTYREIERPSRLVYTWSWEQADHDVGETLVTVEFSDKGGSTEVVLTHERFPNGEAKEAHEQGWGSCLNRLEGMFTK